MKEGTGSDPFADDSFTDSQSSTGEDEPVTNSEDNDENTAQETEDRDRAGTQERDKNTDSDGLPWAVQRNSVKSDREMVQFYLRAFVQERESEFQRKIEAETGYETYLTDVREAAYLVAMNHPEEVADLLDEWGCEYL